MSRSRHVGKIRKRLEEIKNQSVRPTKADFSHNESVRLATDALLDGGIESYRRALNEEGEVDFLSSVEAQYIKKNAREPYYAKESHAEGETGPRQDDAGSLQSGTYFPAISEGSEPALLHPWSTAEKPYLKDKSSATVYFQTDKNSNIRDIIRRCINKTSQVRRNFMFPLGLFFSLLINTAECGACLEQALECSLYCILPMHLHLNRGDASHSMVALASLQTEPFTPCCAKLHLVWLCEGFKVTTVLFGFG